MLEINSQVPDFQCVNQDGEAVNNNTLKGSKYILFFYPKDMTPGCTAEACNLRDNYAELKERGFEIFGVSADSDKRHQKFIEKYDLPYDLLADPEKEMIKSFGVWGMKKFMGKEYEGILRTTYGIDETGKVLFIIDKVKTKNHYSSNFGGDRKLNRFSRLKNLKINGSRIEQRKTKGIAIDNRQIRKVFW